MSEFKWEQRYYVLKLKDIRMHLTDGDWSRLQMMGERISEGREEDGQEPFNAVVVEQDWPEFEVARASIVARCSDDWRSRVIAERDELCDRYNRLRAFTSTPAWEKMDTQGRSLLGRQAAAMALYLDILGQRLRDINEEERP